MHDHALEHLRYIRDTMERAAAFTAVPGWGGVIMGATALATTAIAGPPRDSREWVAIWIGDAIVAAAIGVTGMILKIRRSASPLVAEPTRRFALAYLPPLAAGAVMTVVFTLNGLGRRLPGWWLLSYGTALTTGGALSVRVVPMMGVCFMLLGVAAFAAPAGWGHYFMAAGFGGLHVGFGFVIARHYGG
jgi:hypothetical protein